MSPLSGTDHVQAVMRLLIDASVRNHYMAGRMYRIDRFAFIGMTSESTLAAIAARTLRVLHELNPAAAAMSAADIAGWVEDAESLHEWVVRVAAGWGVDVESIAREIDRVPTDRIPWTMPSAPKPLKVTICGSTSFRAQIAEANRALTLAGYMVYAPGVFGHDGDEMTEQQKADLDKLHFRKIDDSDLVYVVNPDRRIGESTGREIEYARGAGKSIAYLVCPGDALS